MLNKLPPPNLLYEQHVIPKKESLAKATRRLFDSLLALARLSYVFMLYAFISYAVMSYALMSYALMSYVPCPMLTSLMSPIPKGKGMENTNYFSKLLEQLPIK